MRLRQLARPPSIVERLFRRTAFCILYIFQNVVPFVRFGCVCTEIYFLLFSDRYDTDVVPCVEVNTSPARRNWDCFEIKGFIAEPHTRQRLSGGKRCNDGGGSGSAADCGFCTFLNSSGSRAARGSRGIGACHGKRFVGTWEARILMFAVVPQFTKRRQT